MNIAEFLEGVTLLRPYYDNPDDYHIGAEHDVIYVYATDKPLPEGVVKKLCELGWSQEDVTCRNCNAGRRDGYVSCIQSRSNAGRQRW